MESIQCLPPTRLTVYTEQVYKTAANFSEELTVKNLPEDSIEILDNKVLSPASMFIFTLDGSGKEMEKMVVQGLHSSTHGTTDRLPKEERRGCSFCSV